MTPLVIVLAFVGLVYVLLMALRRRAQETDNDWEDQQW